MSAVCSSCHKEINDLAITCPQCGAQQPNPYSVGAASLSVSPPDTKNSFFDWYLDPLKQYAVFSGRTSRKEYWMFFLLNLIIAFAIGVVAKFIHAPWISSLYSLALLIPGFSVAVRRMHDTDRSGWWLIVPIVGLVFACLPGQTHSNRFGPSRTALGSMVG